VTFLRHTRGAVTSLSYRTIVLEVYLLHNVNKD